MVMGGFGRFLRGMGVRCRVQYAEEVGGGRYPSSKNCDNLYGGFEPRFNRFEPCREIVFGCNEHERG
jgi:hypothetical protein